MNVTDLITDMSHTFISEGGPTTEFATTHENWDAKVAAFRYGTAIVRDAFPHKGECRWIVYECSTCEEHTDGECNLHAEIAETKFWPAGHVPEGCVVVFDALAQQEV